MSEQLFKITTSLCPICLKDIKAEIIIERGEVYLKKICSEHGLFKILIEKDADLYQLLYRHEPVKENSIFTSLFIPLTYQCNLECNVCCFPPDNSEDFSVAELKKAILDFGGRIRFSGGEPTLRNDIGDLLYFTNQNRIPSGLITNGIKLADEEYLKRLLKSGLEEVALSFDGFKREHYLKIHGKDLLKNKLKTLSNLKKYKVYTTLSTMLVKGINDDLANLLSIFKFCLRNNKFIKVWRIRPAVQIGRYYKFERLYLSDLVEIIEKISNIEKSELVHHYLISGRDYAPCRFSIDYFRLISQQIKNRKLNNNIANKIYTLFLLIKKIGFANVISVIFRKIREKKELFTFLIELRSWPDKFTVDLNQMKYCLTAHLSEDDKIYPCCYYIIKRSG